MSKGRPYHSRILRDKETLIKRSDEETQPGKYKRKRTFKSEDVDGALNLWVHQKLKQNARLNNTILTAKATQLATEKGLEFIPSNSWVDRFKARH